MPSPRSGNFRGNGGILNHKDGTILDVNFTTENPLFDGSKPAAKGAKSDFTWLYAVLTIQEDGREELTKQPLQVGNADEFEVVLDGRGVSGETQFGKNSGWGVFYESLVHPKDGTDGIDENIFPEDPEGLVADYTNLRGTRVKFGWVNDESKWALANPRKAKDKATGKPLMKDGKQVTYPRQLLVVESYYGQVEVAAPGKTKTAAAKGPKPNGIGKSTKPAVAAQPAADVSELATSTIIGIVGAQKGKPLSKSKLSVKLLQALADNDDAREDVRTWAMNDVNLAAIDGVNYDAASQALTLDAE